MPRIDPVFRGKINARRYVVLDNNLAYIQYRESFKDGQEIELILRRRRKSRSKSQNSYLWGVVYVEVCNSTGYETAEEAHEALRFEFLRVRRDGLLPTVRSTTDLSTAEFSEYVDAIKHAAASGRFGGDGFRIPDPDEVNL